jgi:hypothetical protein
MSPRLRPAEEDEIARDVLGVLLRISARNLYRPQREIPLTTCPMCGSLERADRPCQICAAGWRRVSFDTGRDGGGWRARCRDCHEIGRTTGLAELGGYMARHTCAATRRAVA